MNLNEKESLLGNTQTTRTLMREKSYTEEMVAAAVAVICAGGELQNDIVFYITGNGEIRKTCIVNYLCTRYGYAMPSKVKGWVEKNLISMMVKNGTTPGHTWRGPHDSKAFYDHMANLFAVIIADEMSKPRGLSSQAKSKEA